jgi:DNA polymerase sigma
MNFCIWFSLNTSPTHAGGKSHVGGLDQNLGLLLIDYFRFYGRGLRYQVVGVGCADGGFCYDKVSASFGRQPRDRSDRYSIMDPLDISNDVSRRASHSLGP